MTCKSTVHTRGFTLIELLVVIAIISVLIALLVPAVQKLQQSAIAALQFIDLQPVAADVLQLTCGQERSAANVQQNADALSITCGQDSQLAVALAHAGALVSTVQNTQQPPNAQSVTQVVQELQAVETRLRQDLATLDNPASAHVAREREVYLDLKHSLRDVADKVHVTEIHVTKLKDVASP